MSSVEPKFRNSGLLNNCGLSGALPVILQAFAEFSKLEQNDKYKIHPNYLKNKAQYDNLKGTIAKIYGIEPSTFSYEKASKLFQAFENNTAQQLVMGLALRGFMSENGAKDELTEVQTNGGFKFLAAEDFSQYVYRPLGINFITIETNHDTYVFDDIDNPIATVTLHNDGNHFEPASKEQLSTLKNDREKLNVNNPVLEEVVISLTARDTSIPSDAHKQHTEAQIDIIQSVVKSRYDNLSQAVIDAPKVNHDAKLDSKKFKQELKGWYQKEGFFGSNQQTNITEDTIDSEKANDNESDADFAKRLQIAEYQISGCSM